MMSGSLIPDVEPTAVSRDSRPDVLVCPAFADLPGFVEQGNCAIRTDLARKYVPQTSGFAYMAVMLVQLIKDGCSYREFGFLLQERKTGRSKAFRPRNILSVLSDLCVLFFKLKLKLPA